MAEKNNPFRKERKKEKTKIKEKDMWKCLSKLNDEFQGIKKAKKEAKKCMKQL